MTAPVETHLGTGRSMARPPEGVKCDIRIRPTAGAFRIYCTPHHWHPHAFTEDKSFVFLADLARQHALGDTQC